MAPLILVVEDIHWADDSVLSFLEFLARWGEGPIVIVCLARHELLERRGSWAGGLPNATTIVLEPLGPEASVELMDGLLDGGMPGSLADRIIALAEGNPLFVEEMVRMLVDRGVLRFVDGGWELAGAVDQVEIPGSVQAVLAARLDTLPADEKRVAQDAAVVGRIFWDVLVAHLAGSTRSPTDDLIRRLRVKDLVVQRSPSSLAEASEYGFRHVLIRDVAYDSLPKRDRSRLHRDIALWAEAELSDRIDEFSELIASHLAAALAYEEEFAEDPADLRAIRELTMKAARRAARRAEAMSQVAVATRWLKLGVDLARKLGASAREIAQVTFEYANLALETSDPADCEAVLSLAMADLLSVPDRTPEDEQLVARLREVRVRVKFDLGEVDAARRIAREGIAELEPGPPTAGRAGLLVRLGWTYWRGGPVEDAVPILERAIEEARASGSAEMLRLATHDLGVALAFLDRPDEAMALLEDSYAQARESSDRALLMRCYINIPAIRLSRGDPPGPPSAMTEEGLTLARRSAASLAIIWLAGNQSEFMRDMGRLDEAIAYVDEAIVEARRLSSRALGTKLSLRARTHRLRGDFDAAARDLDEVIRLGPGREPQVAGEYPMSLAHARWPDDPRGAMDALAAWMSDDPGLPFVSEAALEVARMALRLGDRATLAQAETIYGLSSTDYPAPIFINKVRWVEAVAGRTDHLAVEAAAAAFEELGYPVLAADAWADAAIMAARAGVASEAEGRARSLCESMGMHPLLGPLPEARWIRGDLREESAAGA